MNTYLTKSKFKLGLECPTKLYYQAKKEYKNNKLNDAFLKALAKGEFQVGELAKHYYLGRTYIPELDHELSLAKTAELLQNDCIIYEAAFRYQNLFVRSDIIVKQGNAIKLIEVKAKSIDSADESDNFYSEKEKIFEKNGNHFYMMWLFKNMSFKRLIPITTLNLLSSLSTKVNYKTPINSI